VKRSAAVLLGCASALLGAGTPAAEELWIYAAEVPIGAVRVDIVVAPGGGGTIASSGVVNTVKGRTAFTLRAECGADGSVTTLDYRAGPEGVGGARTHVSVKDGRLFTASHSATLGRKTYSVACLLVRDDPVGSHLVLEPVLHEEWGLLGRAQVDVADDGDGHRRLFLRFVGGGVDLREEAVLAAGPRLVSSRSLSTAIRYDRPAVGSDPRRRLEMAPAVLGDPASAAVASYRVGAVDIVVRRMPRPTGTLALDVADAFGAAHARWDLVFDATCVEYAEAARAFLEARGREVRLVTGWAAVGGRWMLHRWVEVRAGTDWLGFDPALLQFEVDASHVPLITHGPGAADRARVEIALAGARGVWPVLLSVYTGP
jgi:hypothetical protein